MVGRPARLRDPLRGLEVGVSGVSGFRGRFWLAAASPFLPLIRLDGMASWFVTKAEIADKRSCLQQNFSNRRHKKNDWSKRRNAVTYRPAYSV